MIRRRLKTAVLAAWIILMIAILVGCGQTKVPNEIVEHRVLEYMDEDGIDDYIRYDLDITHDPNKTTNWDAVQVTLTVQYKCATDILSGSYLYQYNRSSDLWSLISGEELEQVSRTYDANAFLGEHEGTFFFSGSYWIDVEDINFETGKITCAFEVGDYVYSNFSDIWVHYADEGTYDLNGQTLILDFPETTFEFYFFKDGLTAASDPW